MKYFVCAYQLNGEFQLDISEKEKEQCLKIKNVLLSEDHFGPTEVEVLELIESQEERDKYLYLDDLHYKEEDILFIDHKNITKLKYATIFQGDVGLDTESSGGIHVFKAS